MCFTKIGEEEKDIFSTNSSIFNQSILFFNLVNLEKKNHIQKCEKVLNHPSCLYFALLHGVN